MCLKTGSLLLTALNTETVGEQADDILNEGSAQNTKDESDVYKTLAIIAGAGIIMMSIAMVGIYKFSGKRQQSENTQIQRPSELQFESN